MHLQGDTCAARRHLSTGFLDGYRRVEEDGNSLIVGSFASAQIRRKKASGRVEKNIFKQQ